jgi:serine/threonine-protein kinase HipA
MNPTLNEHLSLLISTTSNKADLSILLDACEDYFLNRETAEKIISEVLGAVKDWREPAIRLGISKKEMDMFGAIFTNKTINRNKQ